jgi:arginyl-tRNA--protein-N-Asp/Glu arginylyltransferase
MIEPTCGSKEGSAPAPADYVAQATRCKQQQPRAAFKRRASVSNDKCYSPRSSLRQETSDDQPKYAKDDADSALFAPVVLSVARVCGPSRSRCGYCGGNRIKVLELDDGHNKVLSIGKENINSTSANGSKSYGLLFDRLTYDTFEDLINRGWRRSGKHLYRPHNFESCCPALSIRLESSKFASRSNSQKSKLSDGSDMADSVLVGGSKSQRRVGIRLLRALDMHTKCTPSEDDSVNTSNLANMNIQLGSSVELKATKQICNSGAQHHLKKKSRRFSPGHGNGNSVRHGNSPAALETKEFDRASLHAIENREKNLFHGMANVVYQELTKQAIKKADNPQWAWWNDNTEEIPKWCTFKLVRQGVSIKASTVACAAASGQSHGMLDKVELARALVDRLKDCAFTYLQNNKSCGLRQVKEVSVHEKSGHVHMILDVCDDNLTSTPIDTKQETITQQPQKGADEKVDVIQEVISRYARVDQQFSPNAKIPLNDKCIQRFLTVRSVPVYESSLQPEVHRLFSLYQSTTHGDLNPFADVDNSTNVRDEVHEYNYYKQKNLPGFLDIDIAYSHLDEIRRSKIKSSYLVFYRFLCETPVMNAAESSPICPQNEDGFDIGVPFGTYHQQYRLSTSKNAFDGPLVAVGVVDVLPHCMSSVYSFFDPILSARLELGKYTALREIEWVRRASKYRKELTYYYLGNFCKD